MTHLDLFTGIGGFHLAAQWAGFTTVGFSEIDPYCCKLLAQKWPEIKNYGDLRTADFSGLGPVTVLSAGVPCQPASLAGKRLGEKDHRWLWPATLDVVGSVQPAWCIFENPSGIQSMAEFETVLLRLEALGYAFRLFSVPANAVGADHLRYRVFIVANRNVQRLERSEHVGQRNSELQQFEHVGGQTLANADSAQRRPPQPGGNEHHGQETGRRESPSRFTGSSDSTLADSDDQRCAQLQSATESVKQRFDSCVLDEGRSFRLTEPPLCGATPRIPNRAHRLKALGNAVVPQQAYPFFQAIAQTENSKPLNPV